VPHGAAHADREHHHHEERLTQALGLIANAAAGWWWADPAAALAMLPWLIREGREGIRGESCAESCG
jgi:hypothetical protein